MTVNDARLSYLFQRFADNQSSKEELEELYEKVATVGDDTMHRLMDEWYNSARPVSRATQVDWEAMFREIVQQAPVRKMNPVHLLKTAWFRFAAASLIIMAVGGYLWYVNVDREAQKKLVTTVDKQIIPGGNKAMLTLSDGSTIVLDSAATGTLTTQGNVAVMKLANGQIAYKPEGGTGSNEVLMNTMHTPRGGQYRLMLPDGTQAWLNAASSVTYPVAFTGNERKVQVTGEVYFEVAKRKKMPFIVQLKDGAEIKVLGTHFNVNAYSNEPAMRTTLLEGSVKVSLGTQSALLQPGQQAVVKNSIQVQKQVAMEQVMAWKNGLFNFEDAALDEIMRQLERWYDIEIVYEGKVPQIELAGKLTRDVSLNDLLPALGKMGVHYKLEARKLTILKAGLIR
jgi:ferric-dicitrate binding protein FerR (iron transport regulator)